MPAQSVWMIRLSLIWLMIAVLTGGVLLIHKAVDLHPAAWALLPLHFESAIWGWVVQLAAGTAYWIFPRHLKGKARGPDLAAWIMLLFFNTGLIMFIASAITEYSAWLSLSGRSLITASILIFAALSWQRVVSYRNL
jgi:hypothetical protein